MQNVAPPLRPLVKRLEASRTRLQVRRFLEIGLWVTLGALVVWLGLTLLNILSPSLPPAASWITGLSVLILGLAATLFYLWRTAPGLPQLAQMADRHFELKERLSTALELPQTSNNPFKAHIHQALLNDATQHIEQLEPNKLIRFSWPKHAWYVLGVAAVIALLQLVPQSSITQTPSEAKAQAEAVATLERVAKVVRVDAEQRSDPYLQAVARSLEQLSSDIKKGQVKGEDLQRELSSTLERLSQSYGADTAPLSPSGEGKPGTSDNNASSPNPSAPKSVAITPGGTPSLQKALDKLAQQLESQQRSRSQGSLKGSSQEATSTEECSNVEGFECLTPDEKARLDAELEAQAKNRLRLQGPEGGAPGGSGNKAGKGAQAMFGAKQQPLNKTAAKSFVLPSKPQPESVRRIQIKAAPRANPQAVQDGSAQAGGWQYKEESPVPEGLQALDQQARSVVSQYFVKKEGE